MTSKQSLRVFRQITFQITMGLVVQADIALQASRGKEYRKNNVTCYQNETFLKDLEMKWKTWKKKQNSLSLGYQNETFLKDLEMKWKTCKKKQNSLSLVEW